MKLLVDIGNTRTKWVTTDNGEFTNAGAVLNTDLQVGDLPLPESVKSVWACCVASDQHYQQVADMVESTSEASISRVLVKRTFRDMSNAYKVLRRLGADRWVAAIGARTVSQHGPVIVIDAGTAVTIDAVSRSNQFLGGVILPGSMLMHDALVGRTAGIRSAPSTVESVIGTSTQECVNSGMLFGLVGAIERVVTEISAHLALHDSSADSVDCKVLICGGDADKLIGFLPARYQLEPDLIFHGLSSISEFPE